ncbi:hypothetical protein EF879_23440 [Micromonospora sp. HM5-17]|nr:hypothetical protein EF879_23440 [Micromonospora sp. HM5-17]
MITTPALQAPIGLDHEQDWSRGGDWCTCGSRWHACPLRQRSSSTSTHQVPPPDFTPSSGPLDGPRLTPAWVGPNIIHRHIAAALTGRGGQQRRRGNGGRW